ncbi:MAG: ABC transporter permease [Bacteroidota bacterium]|nr:ABC transporter permease [Bacteroidota bacterium]
MLKNYFKTACRSLFKNKFYSAINISGLAVGLATGILLLLWVQNELSYDKFNKDYQNIFRLSSHFNSDGEEQVWPVEPGPLAVFAKTMPEVKALVRTQNEFDQVLSNKDRTKIFDGNKVAIVDSGFFELFSFKLLYGSKKSLFPNANSVVLTQSTAQKLFGDEEAIGKTVTFDKNNFTVTGVLEDFPENSSLQYDAIFPMAFYAKQFTEKGGKGDWKTIDEDMGNFSFATYVKLQPNANPEKTGQQFSADYKKARDVDSNVSFQLQNLGDIHLINADGNNSALRMVRIFMLVVILLLAIASINYVNLSTARSLIRAKEVSIRKIIGAKKQQLFFQFITETFLLFCFAAVFAIVLISLMIPLYNGISGKTLSFSLADPNVLKAASVAIFGTLVASSIYPAILLSSFKPIEALKGKISSGIGTAALRKGLVIFQFSISVILLVGTIIMSKQMSFIKDKDLGYDKSYVFSVPLTQEVVDHIDAVKNELKKNPSILNVAASDAYNFSNTGSATGDISWPGKPENEKMMIAQVSADMDFIPAMKIKFIEGGNFEGTPADSAHYILNETAVKRMNLKPPYVGQQISFHEKKGTIIGVVRDFNFQSLKEKIAPLIFYNYMANKNILYVRTTGQGARQAIISVKNQYTKYAADSPFSYTFLDKAFEAQYKSDQRSGILFRVFAGIAIFISCLGLFGLATYTAQVKIKEIGIRKVLGASVTGIVQLISKDFLKLVIIAIIIAMPVAWWAMSKWLEGFAYRIHISWWVFALAGLIAIMIALFTVSFQAIKAAMANPVESLRSE